MMAVRRRELASLARALRASRPVGGAIAVAGEVGAGASWLCRRATADMNGHRRLEVRGRAVESDLAGAGLHDLLAALGDEALTRLPPARARAARHVLRLDDGPAPDRLTVSLACLSALAEAGARQPVLVLVDDADRLDPASADALRICAHRLHGTRVTMLVALRSGAARPWVEAGADLIELGGLGALEAAELLRACSGTTVPLAVAERLTAMTAGNPLALTAAARLDPAQLEGRAPLPQRATVPEAIAAAWTERLEGLPPDRARAAVVAALADGTPTAVLVRALAELGLEPETLDAAVELGVAAVGDSPASPLARAAIDQAAAPAARAAARRALATAWAAAGHPEHAAAQLTAVPSPAGPAAAEALARAGRTARRRGAHETAAAAFRTAAAGALEPDRRARLLLEAAAELTRDGRGEEAVALSDELATGRADAALRAQAELVRSDALAQLGELRSVPGRLVGTAGTLAARERSQTVRLLATAAVVHGLLANVPAGRAIADRACAIAAAEPRDAALAQRTLGFLLVLAGEGRRGYALVRRASEQRAERGLPALHAVHASLGRVAMWMEDDETAHAWVRSALARARGEAAPADLALVLACAAEHAFRCGDWTAARERAEDAQRLARTRAQRDAAAAELARLAAVRGDEARARAYAEPVSRHGEGLMALDARATLGLLELACGPPEAAIVELEAVRARAARGGLGEPNVVRWAPDLVEAQARAGRAQEARRTLALLERHAWHGRRRWTPAAVWRCRGMLAEPGDVDDAFVRAEQSLAPHESRFEQARLALCWGERLRRDGRRLEARRRLREAIAGFEALGATPWRERAARELRASGSRPPRRPVLPSEALTAQEDHVARLVAAGHRNKDVAGALFISPKTVEYHLSRIYRKLGVRTRTELALQLRDDAKHRFPGDEDRGFPGRPSGAGFQILER